MTKPTEVRIRSFHPLDIQLPEGDTLQGKVRLVLPDVHVQVFDLSMGIQHLKGTHLGSDVDWLGLDVEFPEPIDVVDFMRFVIAAREQLERLWQAYQAELDKKGALLG